MTSVPASSSQPLSTAEVPRGVPSVEGRDAGHLSTAVGLMPGIMAYGGQDSLEYAKAAAGMGPERNTGDPKPVQHPLNSRADYPLPNSFPSPKSIAPHPQSNCP